MAVINEKELPPNSRPLWLKATSAIETRNFGYAVSLIQVILKESPNFLVGRQWLRRAELATAKGGKGFLKGFSGSSLQAMKSQGLIKKDPQAAILAAEEILEKEPHNIGANSLLRDAAAAAGMIETVGFALETMRDAEPKNTKIMHELARHYTATDQAEKAIEIYNNISTVNPADIEAIKGGKDAAARASMRTGGWDQIGKDGTSYRDVLKNPEEAKKLEAESRIVKDENVIDRLLEQQYALYNENPQNLDVVRKIATLNEDKDDLEGALQYYRWAVELTQNGDPGLVRKVNDLTMKTLDRSISERERWLEENPAVNSAADEEARETTSRITSELEEFRRQKAEMMIKHRPRAGGAQPDRPQFSLRTRRSTRKSQAVHGGHRGVAAGAEQSQPRAEGQVLAWPVFRGEKRPASRTQAVRGCSREAPEHGRFEKRCDVPPGIGLRAVWRQGKISRVHDGNLRGGFRICRRGGAGRRRLCDVAPTQPFESVRRLRRRNHRPLRIALLNRSKRQTPAVLIGAGVELHKEPV